MDGGGYGSPNSGILDFHERMTKPSSSVREEEGKEGGFWTSPMMVSSSSPIPNSDEVANNENEGCKSKHHVLFK